MKKFILGIVSCVWTAPVFAGLYDVSGVFVDVEAANAVQAKERALTDAVIQSFPKLIEKIVLDENFVVQIDMPKESQEGVSDIEQSQEMTYEPKEIIPPENGVVITPQEISALVAGVSVANEKNTPTRYMADVTVQFKPKAVKAYLTERQVLFLDKEPPKMLVIPVFRENETVMVFDDANPLFMALKQNPPKTDFHTLVIPTGDDVDQNSITFDVLNGVDYSALNALRLKYQTPMVLIVDVLKNNNIYTIKTIGVPSNPSTASDIAFSVSSRATNIVAVMTHVMKKTTDYMVRQLKTYHQQHVKFGGKITAFFNIISLSEWNSIDKRLKDFSFVEKIDVRGMSKKQVYVELTFTENTQIALDKMTQAGFVLVPQANTYVWQR